MRLLTTWMNLNKKMIMNKDALNLIEKLLTEGKISFTDAITLGMAQKENSEDKGVSCTVTNDPEFDIQQELSKKLSDEIPFEALADFFDITELEGETIFEDEVRHDFDEALIDVASEIQRVKTDPDHTDKDQLEISSDYFAFSITFGPDFIHVFVRPNIEWDTYLDK